MSIADQYFHDRADELRYVVDLWPEIEKHLDAAAEEAMQHVKWFVYDMTDYTGPALRESMRAKFQKGEAEHGRDWLNMTPNDFHTEVRDEIKDLLIYLAMRKARWVLKDNAPSYLSDRDPGDETRDDDDDDVLGVAV